MNRQREISDLQEELKELFANRENTPNPELEEQKLILSKSYDLEKHIADVSKSLLEINSGSYFSHHSIYEKSLGHTVISAGEKIYAAPWIALTHPDDIAFILKLINISIRFLYLLPQKQITKFSVAYLHRIKNTNGLYDCFVINFRVVLNDKTGKPQLLLVHSRLCQDIPLKNENRYRLIHVTPAGLFKKSKLSSKSEYIMFTKMEKVMVHEVNKGKSCKEIANELHISDTTITKHWRNINTKTGIKTTKQACTYAAQLGILQVFMLFLSFCMDDCCLVA